MENINDVEFTYEYLDVDKSGVNINHFYVPPSKRGEGIGTKVLQDLVSKFKQENLDYIIINMKGGDIAESFLKSNNFDIVDRFDESVTAEMEI